MTKTYRKYNWPELIQQFKDSGLTQTRFCTENNLNAKYFNQKLRQASQPKSPGFSPVMIEAPQATGLSLHLGRCHIQCPSDMPLASIAQLAKLLQ